uniref:Uncharacterized protein n=1 Tax=Nothobranchius rachovii TaxID=451742 RepID=A0A1A8Q319_9TELE
MGVKAVESHMQSEKHKAAAKTREQTNAISQFCTVSPVFPASESPNPAATASASDLRGIFGSTATLQAEVLWCLHSVTRHQSYGANEGITDREAQQRKSAEEAIEELRKKKQILLQVSNSLQRDADKLAEDAEGKSGTLMAQLITKSNTLRKRYREKMYELEQVETELKTKTEELRSIP